MLEKPLISDERILAQLSEDYGLQPVRLTFLPLGVDVNSAVYRVDVAGGKAFFLKLRKGDFDGLSVAVPQLLAEQGLRSIIAPLLTRTQRSWADLDPYRMILYPFVEGQGGYEVRLSDHQWLEFGAVLRGVHAAQVPPALARRIPRERYAPDWREMVKGFQAQIEETAFEDPVAVKTAAFLRKRRADIDRVIGRAGQLARELQNRPTEFVLCHADVHAGNLLLGADDTLSLVDWDNPIFAPKERDLALVGGCWTWRDPSAVGLFYQGYGPAPVDRLALTYFRYERIVQDIAEFCTALLLTSEGGQDREQSYEYLTRTFLPGHDLAIAVAADPGGHPPDGGSRSSAAGFIPG